MKMGLKKKNKLDQKRRSKGMYMVGVKNTYSKGIKFGNKPCCSAYRWPLLLTSLDAVRPSRLATSC